MGSTERSRDRFAQTVVLADIQRFAALPTWLARAAQPTFVSNVLTRSVPEFAAGDVTLHACKIGGLRLNPATHVWTGTYTLTVTTSATEQPQLMPLQGTLFPPAQPTPTRERTDTAFGSTGWRCYVPELRLELAVPPLDPHLPVLPQLTEPDSARVLLEHALRQGEPAYRDVRIQACHPEVLRYQPGLRATVRYQLTYAPDQPAAHDWPAVVVAKTYEGDKGQHAYDGMRLLWNAPLASGADVTIAEPIAYLPALKLLIQGPVPEDQMLKTLIESPIRTQTPMILAELDAYLHKTAAGLAALHRTEVHTGPAYGWADELAEVRAFADHLAAAAPELAGAATSLLAMLDAYARATPPDPPVFAHGTFRPNQVLLHQRQVGLIDFDSWCQAEPALDLALFLTSIKDVGLSTVSKAAQHAAGTPAETAARLAQLARLEAICDTFLADYIRLMPVSRPRVILWEALDLFTLVLRSWDRVKPLRLENTMLLLDRHVRRHLV